MLAVVGRPLLISAFLALLLCHGTVTGVFTSDPTSDASSVFAAPEPTSPYVSELGPATSRPPPPGALPAAGGEEGTASSLPRALGLALALGGGVLVYASLRLRGGSA